MTFYTAYKPGYEPEGSDDVKYIAIQAHHEEDAHQRMLWFGIDLNHPDCEWIWNTSGCRTLSPTFGYEPLSYQNHWLVLYRNDNMEFSEAVPP